MDGMSYKPLPSFISYSNRTFSVYTDDVSDAGVYVLSIVASVPLNPEISAESIITLEVDDPCHRAIVNQDAGLVIGDLTTSDSLPFTEAVYYGPTDSISTQYGNGFNKCGTMQYTLTDREGNALNLDMFSL